MPFVTFMKLTRRLSDVDGSLSLLGIIEGGQGGAPYLPKFDLRMGAVERSIPRWTRTTPQLAQPDGGTQKAISGGVPDAIQGCLRSRSSSLLFK